MRKKKKKNASCRTVLDVIALGHCEYVLIG